MAQGVILVLLVGLVSGRELEGLEENHVVDAGCRELELPVDGQVDG
jgi:hypothetical protein